MAAAGQCSFYCKVVLQPWEWQGFADAMFPCCLQAWQLQPMCSQCLQAQPHRRPPKPCCCSGVRSACLLHHCLSVSSFCSSCPGGQLGSYPGLACHLPHGQRHCITHMVYAAMYKTSCVCCMCTKALWHTSSDDCKPCHLGRVAALVALQGMPHVGASRLLYLDEPAWNAGQSSACITVGRPDSLVQ